MCLLQGGDNNLYCCFSGPFLKGFSVPFVDIGLHLTGIEKVGWNSCKALFRLPQNFKFFHSLCITLIFRHMYGALNVGKK